MVSSFLAFLGVSAVVIMTPGPDTAVTVRNTLLGGRLAGIATALGISTGQAIWALATKLRRGRAPGRLGGPVPGG
jgi:threonine/homoserine/homoserine lactone efflux protein